MTTQPGQQPLRVGSPAALLAVVPHLLGFVPANSLVIVGARGPRGRIDITFRFDLPDPPDHDATAEIAAHAAALLASQQFTLAVAIGYGPGPLVTPLADAIRREITGTGLELRDVLRVHEGRYWSYLCQNPACCPADGVRFDTATHPASAAMTAHSGQRVLANRDELAATIAPVSGASAEAMRRETARAERIAANLTARTATTSGTARAVIEHGLKAVQAAIATYRDGGSVEISGQFAWLALALSSLRVRDDAWARMDPAHRHAHQRMWTDLVRHARPGYVRRTCLPAGLHRLPERRRSAGQPRARPGPHR